MTLASAYSPSRVTASSRLTALRVPPTVALSFAVIALAIAWSLAPGLFTSHDPVNGVPARQAARPQRRRTGSAPTIWAATSIPASSMARPPR